MSILNELEKRLTKNSFVTVIDDPQDRINIYPLDQIGSQFEKGPMIHIPTNNLRVLSHSVSYNIAPKNGLYSVEALRNFRDSVLPKEGRSIKDFHVYEWCKTKILEGSIVKYQETIASGTYTIERKVNITDTQLYKRKIPNFKEGVYEDKCEVSFDCLRRITIKIYPSEEIARTVLDPDFSINGGKSSENIPYSWLKEYKDHQSNQQSGRLSLAELNDLLGRLSLPK